MVSAIIIIQRVSELGVGFCVFGQKKSTTVRRWSPFSFCTVTMYVYIVTVFMHFKNALVCIYSLG